MMDAEVIIAGAGPAGAQVAHRLSRAGVSVLILEKYGIPRYKACGGAISRNSLQILQETVTIGAMPVETTVNTFTFRYPGLPPATHSDPHDSMSLVMREAFDAFLVGEAVDAGARLLTETPVNDLRVDHDGVTVETAAGSFRGAFLVGADGANSIVARRLGFGLQGMGPSVEAEVYFDGAENWPAEIILDYGHPGGGYRWVFPKGQHLSVGIGRIGIARGAPSPLRKNLLEYLEFLGIDPRIANVKLRGHPIPVAMRSNPVGRNFLLVGDAARLADPLTGEGIHNAVKSAELAARVIVESPDVRRVNTLGYTDLLKQHLAPELRIAGYLSRLFNLWPELFHRVILSDERILATFMSLVRGSTGYRQVYREIGAQLLQQRRRHLPG